MLTSPEDDRSTAAAPKLSSLTDRQKQYIWLLGSHPRKIAVQGRGYRAERLLWGTSGEELVLFGYSSPFLWLERRGLVRRLANADAYVLTEMGETVFRELLIAGAGLKINRQIREVSVA
ncbi:MAG: hypothetical protein ACOY5R_10580 [Pseudomonadota bacterium]